MPPSNLFSATPSTSQVNNTNLTDPDTLFFKPTKEWIKAQETEIED
jgi:hypothetical protein